MDTTTDAVLAHEDEQIYDELTYVAQALDLPDDAPAPTNAVLRQLAARVRDAIEAL